MGDMRIKHSAFLLPTLLIVVGQAHGEPRRLSREGLLDKIRGAWAAQMIGVSYGAPVEFKFNGKMIEIDWKPADLSNAIDQDDLYVEMTFAHVMDTIGLDATTADYGEAFKNSKYRLWHANAAARRNLNRGLKAPLSGDPKYNMHSDDIDFQIEADFIGLMCPGLPQVSNKYCERVGRVMNYGDGVYGGMFIAGMYTAAFFENDPRKVVEAGLACIPAESPYAMLIADILNWSEREPDWRKVWHKIESKWDKDDVCPDGVHRPFNIDAKINGGYVAMGLLYGNGDWHQTMDVAARCGQDADCNPASALGILGAMLGFEILPPHYKDEIAKLADQRFSYTEYSFNEIVKSTETRALEVIRQAGGAVNEEEVEIPLQSPKPPKLELARFGRPVKVHRVHDVAWKWKGNWSDSRDHHNLPSKQTDTPGSEATLNFNGTGLGLSGNLSEAGGRAEVYIDGVKSELLADAYIGPNTNDVDLWHVHGLPAGEHTLRLVLLEESDPRSSGRKIMLTRAIVYLENESATDVGGKPVP
jgi:hypothetical protein